MKQTSEAYPHAFDCQHCREALLCNYCGESIAHDFSRCTNGRCGRCHRAVCGTGGATGPGHAYFRK